MQIIISIVSEIRRLVVVDGQLDLDLCGLVSILCVNSFRFVGFIQLVAYFLSVLFEEGIMAIGQWWNKNKLRC